MSLALSLTKSRYLSVVEILLWPSNLESSTSETPFLR